MQLVIILFSIFNFHSQEIFHHLFQFVFLEFFIEFFELEINQAWELIKISKFISN